MRAVPAALSAVLFALMAISVPPVAAQCTLDVRQERDAGPGPGAARVDAATAERGAAGEGVGWGMSADLDLGRSSGSRSGLRSDLRSQPAHLEPRPAEANAPGGPGLRFNHVAEAFAVRVAAPLTGSRPHPYQPYLARPPGAPPLKSEDVAASLKARGFVDVSAVRQRGRSFLAEATGPRGERVRLVLDADSGEINGMQVIGFRPATP
ncbi:hypothetical protein [Xanthobacter autotrophicus]|uniref:hypothetical protein n=1 Tax=Xanthobacter autotrophicus TaxID=280 RepID=UPI0037285990